MRKMSKNVCHGRGFVTIFSAIFATGTIFSITNIKTTVMFSAILIQQKNINAINVYGGINEKMIYSLLGFLYYRVC